MSTTTETSQGQTGAISKPEVEQLPRIGSTGNFNVPQVGPLPITGIFPASKDGVEIEPSDDNYSEVTLESAQLNLETILTSTEEARIKLMVMNECEHYFTSGLLTGVDSLDAMNHAFRHIENTVLNELCGISLDTELNNQGDKKFLKEIKLTQEYFNRTKIMVQTYAEYLRTTRGIPKYTLKAFLANYSLTLEGKYNGRSDEDISTLAYLNTFLPHLINEVKDNKDLKFFTERLIGLLYYMKKRDNISFIDLSNSEEFQEIVQLFTDEYLDCKKEFLLKILYKLHTNIVVKGSVFEESKLPRMFDLIRQLNNMEFIGHDTDYFINKIVRTIRLESIPSTVKYLFEDGDNVVSHLRRDIADSHNDSRLSINGSVQIAEDAVDTREAMNSIPSKYFKEFNSKMFSFLSDLPLNSKYDPSLPSFVLRKLFAEETDVYIKDPEEVVRYFFTLLDSALIEIEDRIYAENGLTISDNSLFYLVILWRQEIAFHFERIAQQQNPRFLEKFDVYLLKLLNKSDVEIEEYKLTFLDLNDPRPERAIEETFNVNAIVSDYVKTFKKRLAAKYAIRNVKYENPDERYAYKQYVLEIFSTFIRSEVKQDEFYYADDIGEIMTDMRTLLENAKKADTLASREVIQMLMGSIPSQDETNSPKSIERTMSDLNASIEARRKPVELVNHIMRTIAGASKFIKIKDGQIVNKMNKSLMTDVLSSQIRKNKLLLAIFEKAFNTRGDFKLEYYIDKYLENPNSVRISDSIALAEA